VPRSFVVQRSSTAPEEKKKTAYGVIAAPNRAIAKYQYVAADSFSGMAGGVAC